MPFQEWENPCSTQGYLINSPTHHVAGRGRESAALFILGDAKGCTQKVPVISNLQSTIKNKGEGSTHGLHYKSNQLQKAPFLEHENLEKEFMPSM